MRWTFRGFLATFFVLEGLWFLLRSVIYAAEGWPLHVPWLIGLLLGPVSFFAAAWSLWRSEPPTPWLAAIARAWVVFIAVGWNLLAVYAMTQGHFRPTL